MSEEQKPVSRRALTRLALGSALLAGTAAQGQEGNPNNKRKPPVREIHLQISDNAVTRRDPQTEEAIWSSLVAFDADSADVSRLGRPITIPEGLFESQDPPSPDLPELLTGTPDFSDVEPLEEGEVLTLAVTFIQSPAPVVDVGGVLTVTKLPTAANPSPIKLGRIIFSFERQKDIIPPCLANKKLTGVKIKVDLDWYISTNRLFSTYLSRNSNDLYLHGEIGAFFHTFKWCWKFSRLIATLIDKFTWVVAQALDLAGFRETAAKVKTVVNSILAAIRKASPGLIP